jgi:hypothetical protein
MIAETAVQKRRTLPTQGCSVAGWGFIFHVVGDWKKSVNKKRGAILRNQCKTSVPSHSLAFGCSGGWRNLNSLKRFGCPTLSGLVYERVGSLLLSLF